MGAQPGLVSGDGGYTGGEVKAEQQASENLWGNIKPKKRQEESGWIKLEYRMKIGNEESKERGEQQVLRNKRKLDNRGTKV